MNRFSGMRLLAVGLALYVLSAPLRGSPLIRDINLTPGGENYQAVSSVDLPATTLFTYDDGIHGLEIWVTDGTATGTALVRDIRPGPAGSDVRRLVVSGATAYFWADDGTNGLELWRSDGTSSGTRIVANIGPDDRVVDGETGSALRIANGIVYFFANDGKTGQELWRSDGTASGTYHLSTVAGGSGFSELQYLTVLGSRVFFRGTEPAAGAELWTSDGTPAGTRTLDVNPGPGDAGPKDLIVVGNTLYFTAGTASTGEEVGRATADGSTTVIDVVPGALSSLPQGLVPVGTGIAFTAYTSAGQRLFGLGPTGNAGDLGPLPCSGIALVQASAIILPARTLFDFQPGCYRYATKTDVWGTDGTPAGTGPMQPAALLNFPSAITLWALLPGGDAVFLAYSNVPGTLTPGTAPNVWRTDGTPGGTRPLTDNPYAMTANSMLAYGGKVYFDAGHISDTQAGQEMWTTDGTTAGTQRVFDLLPGPQGSGPDQLRIVHGQVLFLATDESTGRQPWVTDGTLSGTQRLGVLHNRGTGDANPEVRVALGGGVLFTADDGLSGRELWFSDGTSAGTRLVKDIAPGPPSSDPAWFVAMDGYAMFMADDGVSGRELWRTDGSPGGTFRLANIWAGAGDGDPLMAAFGAVVVGGTAYFGANNGNAGPDLWRSDGTAQGTYLLADLSPAGSYSSLVMLRSLNGLLLFAAQANGDMRLWVSDGTAAGTHPLRTDITFSSVLDVALFQGYLYFQGFDASGDRELWRSDGTPDGTTLVADLDESGSSYPHTFRTTENVLAFAACAAGSCGLYGARSSGAVNRIGGPGFGGALASDGDRIYFVDSSVPDGRLAVTDGTSAGTGPFLRGQLPFSGQIGPIEWFAGALVFSLRETGRGSSIWRSDGTTARTHRLLETGSSDQVAGGYFVLGSQLYFTASSPANGMELWMIDSRHPWANDDTTSTPFNSVVRIGVLANDIAFAGVIDGASVEIVSPPGAGTAMIDSGGDIVYTPEAGRSGSESFRYSVRDSLGATSNEAVVTIRVAAQAGPGPGEPPGTPDPPDPPTGGGGGGGALGSETCLLLLLQLRRRLRGSTPIPRTLSPRLKLSQTSVHVGAQAFQP